MTKRANYLFIDKQEDIYTISMTPELQDDIGTVGYVDFAEEATIAKDDPIVSLEASKTVLEVTSPLAGKIVEKNEAAAAEPTLLNSEKPEENWLVRLTDVDEAAFNGLEEA